MENLKARNPWIPKLLSRKIASDSVSCSPFDSPIAVVRASATESAENERRPREGMDSFELILKIENRLEAYISCAEADSILFRDKL